MILRARYILPISRAPIENGAIAISAGRVAAVGHWEEIIRGYSGPRQDLGEVVLLPGLVNAHCHLDYTDMAGLIPPQKNFPDWIKSILALKSSWTYSDYAQSWLRGAKMLLANGVTTVADTEAVPELLPDVLTATPLRVLTFLEMTGIRSGKRPLEILSEAEALLASLSKEMVGGLSPHAPYSTLPEIFRLSAESARRRGWIISTHVAESIAEFDMFMKKSGPLYTWLRKQRPMDDCGGVSPLQHLYQTGIVGENLLAIHVNYLAEGDAELLGAQSATVVHCPRSHAYFRHQSFPYEELRKAHVNVCLGTDSLASVNKGRGDKITLDLFAEMQTFASAHPRVAPPEILRMVTTNPAKSLKRSTLIGELASGSLADVIAIPFTGSLNEIYEHVVRHSGEVSGTMIGGRWIKRPGSTETT